MAKDSFLKLVTLDAANRKRDKSIGLRFTTTTEQSPMELMEVDKLIGYSGALYFKSNGNLTTAELDEIDKVDFEIEGKTKSQRLRAALYVLFEQTKAPGEDFKDFYANRMDQCRLLT